ncbi:MAG: hypothetical protein ACOC6F_01105 [bacterium]
MNRTEKILEQGKALVRAIEALGTIEATGPLERSMVRLLLRAYRQRLRAIVGGADVDIGGDPERQPGDRRRPAGAVDE